jgi:hypothetical protein
MEKTEKRKLRDGLTQEQREKADRIGSLPVREFKTAWSMRVEKFIPSREQH